MVTLAKNYFGFNPDHEQIESVIGDAYKYVMERSADQVYDIIICDVNCTMEDQSISPPWNFFSEEYLSKLVSLMNPECSYLAMNILYYDLDSKSRVFDTLKQHVLPKVDKVSYLESENWTNKVFIMSKDQTAKSEELVGHTQALENLLKSWNVQNRKNWIEEMEMGEHINSL